MVTDMSFSPGLGLESGNHPHGAPFGAGFAIYKRFTKLPDSPSGKPKIVLQNSIFIQVRHHPGADKPGGAGL